MGSVHNPPRSGHLTEADFTWCAHRKQRCISHATHSVGRALRSRDRGIPGRETFFREKLDPPHTFVTNVRAHSYLDDH